MGRRCRVQPAGRALLRRLSRGAGTEARISALTALAAAPRLHPPPGRRGKPPREILLRDAERKSSLAALLEQLGDEARPAGLVAGADARAVVAVKVLVEEHEVTPVWVALEFLGAAVDGPASVGASQEDARQPPRQLRGDLPEVQPRAGAGRELDLQGVAVEVVELLQRLEQQIVHRKPDRPAPVRVAAEYAARRLGRLVVDPMVQAVHVQDVWVVLVIPRHPADAV